MVRKKSTKDFKSNRGAVTPPKGEQRKLVKSFNVPTSAKKSDSSQRMKYGIEISRNPPKELVVGRKASSEALGKDGKMERLPKLLLVFENPNIIQWWQNWLERIFEEHGSGPIPVLLSKHRPKIPVNAWWYESAGIWMASQRIEGKMYRNTFGIEKPKSQSTMSTTCEINFPLRGFRRNICGALALGDEGKTYMVYRCSTAGGNEGVSKQRFWQNFAGTKLTIKDGAYGVQEADFALVGELNSAHFLEQMGQFVQNFMTAMKPSSSERTRDNQTFPKSQSWSKIPDGDRAEQIIERLPVGENDLSTKGGFDPGQITDERRLAERLICERQGQCSFRESLLVAYKGRCAVTNCDAEPALEAAHISPYRGPDSNHISNGILLRADIHSLFDRGLIAVDPNTKCVILSSALRDTSYGKFGAKRIAEPMLSSQQPSKLALQAHLNWCRENSTIQ